MSADSGCPWPDIRWHAPHAIALRFGAETLTYRALDERSNQLAQRLRRAGVDADVMVGVCLERSVELIVTLLAIAKAGGAYVSLDPAYPKDRLTFMLEDTATRVLVTQQSLREKLPLHHAAVICTDVDAASLAEESSDAVASSATAASSTATPRSTPASCS